MGQQSLISETSFSTRIPAEVDDEKFSPSSTTIPAPPEEGVSSILYFLMRCRLVQTCRIRKNTVSSRRFARLSRLCKTIRKQLNRDILLDDASESSIDQAASYEKDVRNFLSNELPPAYRLDMDLDITQPLDDDPVLLVQRAALHIIANRVVIKLYLPFMKDTNDLPKSADQPVLGTIHAAHSIIYASRILYTVWHESKPGIFEYYDYGRSLFDAAVICAQAVIQQPTSLLAADGMKRIADALEVLHAINTSNKLADAIHIVEMMREKAERARALAGSDAAATVGSKRKRPVDDEQQQQRSRVMPLAGGFQLPFVGPSVSSSKGMVPRPPLAMSKIASNSARSASPADSRTSKTSVKGKDKETEKEKERIEKGKETVNRDSRYPPIGVRARFAEDTRRFSTASPSPSSVAGSQPQAVSQATSSTAHTPISDQAYGYPPQAPQQHQMEAMQQQRQQQQFTMEYGQADSSEGSPLTNGHYGHGYSNSSSSPPAVSSMYEQNTRPSPYIPATHPATADSFQHVSSPQEYYIPQYPAPPTAPSYDQRHMDHTNMHAFAVNPALGAPMPTGPLVSPNKTTPPYDPHMGKAQLHRQMSHEYPRPHPHPLQAVHPVHQGMPMANGAMPYVQGWQPEMAQRQDTGMWDPKFYSYSST